MSSILIADDDKTCRDSIQKVLEKEGYTVRTAEDVDSALGELCLAPFDLIVCDYRMPGKNGLDLLLELRRMGSEVPVLMISAYADAATTADVLKLGALAVLRKPIRRQELIDQAAWAVGAGLQERSVTERVQQSCGSRTVIDRPCSAQFFPGSGGRRYNG